MPTYTDTLKYDINITAPQLDAYDVYYTEQRDKFKNDCARFTRAAMTTTGEEYITRSDLERELDKFTRRLCDILSTSRKYDISEEDFYDLLRTGE